MAFIKPYKRTYMNVLDTLLLAHLTVLCALLTRAYYSDEGTQIFIDTLIPAAVFKLILLLMIVVKLKNGAVQSFKKLYKQIIHSCSKFARKVKVLVTDSAENQPLIHPTSSVVSI